MEDVQLNMKKDKRAPAKANSGRGNGRVKKTTQDKAVEETVSTPTSQLYHRLLSLYRVASLKTSMKK